MQFQDPAEIASVAVVVPCYRVAAHIRGVIEAIGPEVSRIYVVDDKCPEQSGDLVENNVRDPRIAVIRHQENMGVGGAVLTGMRRALADGATIIVKLDGDGQMDPALVPILIAPLLKGEADYAKGNRFYDLEALKEMPTPRIIGNAALSFISKLSTGYWDIFDPTNGFLAIDHQTFRRLSVDKISRRYFFESDMLFRLYLIRAVVVDVPMFAKYGSERSGIRASRAVVPFFLMHLRNLFKRIFYAYFLRDFSIASVYVVLGLMLTFLGTAFGLTEWIVQAAAGTEASAGTVMLAALPIIIGVQMLLNFLGFDIGNVPRLALQRRLAGERHMY